MTPGAAPEADALYAVLKVVRDVVGAPAVGPHDDFFAVGGHSLLVLTVIRRLEVEYGLSLDVRAFYVNAQLASLALACRPVGE